MKIDRKLWDMYELPARIWMLEYDEDEVRDVLNDSGISEEVMDSAVSQANYWVYNRRSTNWDYFKNNAVEKQVLRNDPERAAMRRVAFIRYVLSTIVTHYPEVVSGLVVLP